MLLVEADAQLRSGDRGGGGRLAAEAVGGDEGRRRDRDASEAAENEELETLDQVIAFDGLD